MAARAGMFARSDAISGGLALLACAGTIAVFGSAFAIKLQALLSDALSRALAGGMDCCSALSKPMYTGLMLLFPILACVFVAALVGAVAPAIVAKRHQGRSAVPLPPIPKTRFATVIIRAAGGVVMLLLSAQILRSHAPAALALMGADFSAGADLVRGFCGLLAAAGVVMILIGIGETAIQQNAYFRALHLTTLESRQEQRAAGGDPTARAEAKRRQRKEAWS